MISTRPAWSMDEAVENDKTEISELLNLEMRASDAAKTCMTLAQAVLSSSQVDGIAFLGASARNDLVAGCELARAGYMKQAYSLWRSWYEQSLFALYFLEAPIHRLAWKVSPEVGLDDSPAHRLMLHQLLNEGSERHPFMLVYTARYLNLLQALQVGKPAKKDHPTQKAISILTTLSQGVHGTFQPPIPRSQEESCTMVSKHCLPVLSAASNSLITFWLLLLLNEVDLPSNILIRMRETPVSAKELAAAGLDDADKIEPLGPLFKQVFGTATK